MNLNYLKSFLVVVRKGNLSAAAKELGTNQPNLGRQMTALEEEIGIKLFVRHSRGMVLTELGQEFHELSQRIVGQWDQEAALIREKSLQAYGTLKILAGVGMGQRIIEHLPLLADKHPRLCFKIVSSPTATFQFKSGEADVGIVPFESSDPDLVQHYLYDVALKLYASPAYFEHYPLPKTMEDLCHHNIVFYSAENPEITKFVNIHLTGNETKDAKYKHFVDINNGLALPKALLNGLGIGTMWYDRDLMAQNLLVDIFPHMPARKMPYYYTYHRRLEGSPKVRAFHEFLKETFTPIYMEELIEK